MSFNCGIVGLPNVGKSTIFNALTNGKAEAANYPFCTIDPNRGIVPVPDTRLDKICELIVPDNRVATTVEFVDIAGLVKGASQGEGLGNQFLGHIKNVNALAHIVRCFEDVDVVHVHGQIDPIRDIEVIKTELILADLDTAQKRLDRIKKLLKGPNKEAEALALTLEKLIAGFNAAQLAIHQNLSAEEKECLKDLFLLTIKPFFYVCNVDEKGIREHPPTFKHVEEYAAKEGAQVIKICGKFEAELAELSGDDRLTFLHDAGLTHSGLETMAQTGYRILELITFFTAGKKEVKAWTVENGALAPQAAGVIHSDFERGFIKAEVYRCEDLFRLGSVGKIHDAGLMRMEGKEYFVKDGDVMLFKFNV